jgi:S1-C subfamily serine protease
MPIAVAKKLRTATVRVDTPDGGFGSGFVRKLSDGSVWVWTCAHVAASARLPDGHFGPLRVTHRPFSDDDRARVATVADARVVRLDSSLDVALLEVRGPVPGAGSLNFSRDVPLLTPLVCCGCPKGFDYSLTRGALTYRDRRTPMGLLDQTDVPSLGGSSGGPVVGLDGLVVGIVCGGVGESFTCIVPARTIKSFAAREQVHFAYDGDIPPLAPPTGPPETVAP